MPGCSDTCHHRCSAGCRRAAGYWVLFPDTDDRYKGISSLKLLENVGKMITESGFLIGNIDTTVIAEKPKLADILSKA